MRGLLVDIHNHILPGLDDGPESLEEALLLAENAVANGITHIIATPHHRNRKYNNPALAVKLAAKSLNEELLKQSIPLHILCGQETYFYNEILQDLEGNLLTLGESGKYLLLELPTNYFPAFIFDILLELQFSGYIPIIVHPERCEFLKRDKQLCYELVRRGALFQVNASTIVGENGLTMQRFAKHLIKHNLVHFIASDAHHYKNRPFLIKSAYKYIQKKFSSHYVTYFMDNANHVLEGSVLQPIPPISFKKNSTKH